MKKEEIEKILSKISMAPSCIDMGWRWRVTSLGKYGNTFALSFQRPDTNTGLVGTGYGREWFVPNDATEKFIVMTAWLAIELILRHEAMEAFHYDNARILDPHKSIGELAQPDKLGETAKTKLQFTGIEKV